MPSSNRTFSTELPNWVYWVLSFIFIIILGRVGNIGKDNAEQGEGKTTKEEDKDANPEA